jgi:hypothetical protein
VLQHPMMCRGVPRRIYDLLHVGLLFCAIAWIPEPPPRSSANGMSKETRGMRGRRTNLQDFRQTNQLVVLT